MTTTHRTAHRSIPSATRPQGLQPRLLALAVACSAALGAVSAQAAPPAASSEGPWAKGRVLVMPKPGLPDTELAKVAKEHGGKFTKLTSDGLHLLELPGNASEKAVAARLAHNPHFKFVELDQAVAPTGVANDPYFGSGWHLTRLNVPLAWDASQGAGVTIAVLDTGVDASHPDLSSKLVAGWNFYDSTSNTSDVHGHGTGVAGAAAAATNNATGVAAVAGGAKIMPIRISDASGVGYWSMIAQGINWAADRGARVINISYDQLLLSSSVLSAAQSAKNKGALVIVAAGNRAKDEAFTPSTALIPVSAVDRADAMTSWSSWGKFVAVSAPGLDIWSTTKGGGYGAWWGTSVASPVTAGVVALMMAANPALSSTQVESLLFSTAVDLGAAGRDSYFGYGRVNASAAVQAALNTKATLTDTQAPTASIASPTLSSTVSGVASVTVNAADNVGVAKVELRANGALVATDTAAPYSFAWDTTRLANGMANLEARAYDAAGNVGASSVVAVNVANAADITPPTVRISNPANGSRVSGNVSVTVGGSDNAGVSGLRMELLIGSQVVASSVGTSSLSYNWNTRKLQAGTYTLKANARDAAGNLTSTTITVTR
jgi:thermitase